MAIDVSELESLRDALIRARAQGVRQVTLNGKRIEYGSDTEMAAAVSDLEARIARASPDRPSRLALSLAKGT